MLLSATLAFGQPKQISLNEAIATALQNNKELASYALQVEQNKALVSTAFSPDKGLLQYSMDQNNIAEMGFPLHVFGIEQSFNFPTYYLAQHRTKKIEVSMAEANYEIQKNQLISNVADC